MPSTSTTTTAPRGGTSSVPFVACGPNRDQSMISPYTTFASAQASFPNAHYVDVPAGDNTDVVGLNWSITANTTYYFEPGVHTIGDSTDPFAQIAPKNSDVFVGAPGAVLDGQEGNQTAFGGQASNVTIEYLEVRRFVSPLDQGVVNHDAGTDWTMKYDYMHDNGGAAMILGDHNTAEFNCLDHNAQYGFQIFGNVVSIMYNEVSHNDSANVESTNPGCGCSGGMKAWGASNVVLDHNWVHDNMNVGLWVDTNDAVFDISYNVITDNSAEAIIYELSYNFNITNNVIARNEWTHGMENRGFPNPAVYISESGGDARVSTTYANSSVSNNTFVDNWGGVTLWENADRYCSSGGNSSTGTCTLVNGGVATLTTCADAKLIGTVPYINDCRWKTQNVTVSGNLFSFNQANIPNCTRANGCGMNALLSNSGSDMGNGDPYLGDFVQKNIVWHQNNHYRNNTYVGPWMFQPWDQATTGDLATWQNTWLQDGGSTVTP